MDEETKDEAADDTLANNCGGAGSGAGVSGVVAPRHLQAGARGEERTLAGEVAGQLL